MNDRTLTSYKKFNFSDKHTNENRTFKRNEFILQMVDPYFGPSVVLSWPLFYEYQGRQSPCQSVLWSFDIYCRTRCCHCSYKNLGLSTFIDLFSLLVSLDAHRPKPWSLFWQTRCDSIWSLCYKHFSKGRLGAYSFVICCSNPLWNYREKICFVTSRLLELYAMRIFLRFFKNS